MARPWMPMYWGNYFGDTRHLTQSQHACYLLLIGHYWMTGGLPDDDDQLARITCSTPESWQIDKPVVRAFFHDNWRHKRIDEELRKTTEKIAQAKAAGSKGGTVASMNREAARWKNQRVR